VPGKKPTGGGSNQPGGSGRVQCRSGGGRAGDGTSRPARQDDHGDGCRLGVSRHCLPTVLPAWDPAL